MPHTFPDARFERVRDHLERAIAILHKDEATQCLRDMIEEAVDLALECAYRSSASRRSYPPSRPISSRPPHERLGGELTQPFDPFEDQPAHE